MESNSEAGSPLADPAVVRRAYFHRIFSDPTRIVIVRLLSTGPRGVSEIVAATDAPNSTVSHHLGMLKKAGLLTIRQDGAARICELTDNGVVVAGVGHVIEMIVATMDHPIPP